MLLLSIYFVLVAVHGARHVLVNKEDVLSALEKLLIQRETSKWDGHLKKYR